MKNRKQLNRVRRYVIEKNRSLPTITGRSRDNLRNPVATSGDPYMPPNSPATTDLMEIIVV